MINPSCSHFTAGEITQKPYMSKFLCRYLNSLAQDQPLISYKSLLYKRGAQISCVVLMALLAGCGNDDFSDLNRYLAEVKARPKEPIKPLPEIKAIEPFMFKPESLRDPFKPLEQPDQAEGIDASTGSGIKPDTARRKEELEDFPLDGLRMVGTINMKSSLWGLVKASNGTIYRVKVGNYMGKNYGKIIRIVSDKIELMEIVPDKPGTWREQPTSIMLTE